MGHILSKIFKSQAHEPNSDKITKVEAQTQTSAIEDFQSSSTNVFETPIKEKYSAREVDLDSLKSKMPKNLHLDPRSPTVGIYRTPIIVQDLGSSDCTSAKCDSPISVYSSNGTFPVGEEIMTPIEPSVNVSDFEKITELEDNFESSTCSCSDEQEITKEKGPLKISDQPNTSAALKLLREIQLEEEENFIKRIHSTKKIRKGSSKISNIRGSDKFKLSQTKTRTPLSNITSSTNSPSSQMNSKIKFSSQKVVPETGNENSFISPKPQHLVQWDQNNTVII